MPLVTLNEVLPQAQKAGYAIPAINVANLETTLAVFKAAQAKNSPIIIQVYQRLFNDERAAMIAAMTTELAKKTEIPVVLHLDHGISAEQIQQAIELGYSSVMIDGSQLLFAENIALTSECVKIARQMGVSVEAEIGHVPFGGGKIALSTPAEAGEFVKATGVDALAVSVGTAHGYYKDVPCLDLQLAAEIGQSIGIPLVLHGGTGVPAEQLRKVMGYGFAKINIATEFQHLFLKEIRYRLNETDGKFSPVDLFMVPVETKLKDYISAKIDMLKNH
ncbi:MAG: class II fructose-bisphosphate aldolase [Victivallales bacterium]|nr:class II fructose-bisphosphate aldolase [Victivallales bacterium]